MLLNNNLNNIRESYKAKYDDNSILIKNICNFGLKKGQKAKLMRNGEYYGFAIEILEDVRQLLTDNSMKYILDNYDNKDKIIKYFNLETYYTKYGEEILDYIVSNFFYKNEIQIPEFIKKDIKIKDDDIDRWIKTTRDDIINYKLKIYEIGKNKTCTVVPEEWIDREFDSGKELHIAIDKLEWRKEKPKCCFCCIYSMIIQDELLYIDSLDKLNDKKYDIIIILYEENDIKNELGKKKKSEFKKVKVDKNSKILVSNNLIIIIVYK